MLNFNPRWRFKPPENGRYKNKAIPVKALREFIGLIEKTTIHGNRWNILERYKGAFASACGISHVRSSSEDWAASDLSSRMGEAAKNAPVFLDAFHAASERLRTPELFTPDAEMINDLCEKHEIGYLIRPPDLILRETLPASVPVQARPPSVGDTAREMLQQSLQRAEQLLAEGRDREAVQETLWVLESLTTAFRGVKSKGKAVSGKYFNDIVKDLRKIEEGSTFERVLEWINSLHGYLSSPSGGGVRHGIDLNRGTPIGPSEGRLFCNLIRSYVEYLLSEHERLHQAE